jgi:hypothetical protein
VVLGTTCNRCSNALNSCCVIGDITFVCGGEKSRQVLSVTGRQGVWRFAVEDNTEMSVSLLFEPMNDMLAVSCLSTSMNTLISA